MKETSPFDKDQVENVKQVQQESKMVYEGNIKMYPGHKMWEINPHTNEIRQAEMELLPAPFFKKEPIPEGHIRLLNPKVKNVSPVAKIVRKEGMIYVSSLTMKSAFKKIGIRNFKILKIKK